MSPSLTYVVEVASRLHFDDPCLWRRLGLCSTIWVHDSKNREHNEGTVQKYDVTICGWHITVKQEMNNSSKKFSLRLRNQYDIFFFHSIIYYRLYSKQTAPKAYKLNMVLNRAVFIWYEMMFHICAHNYLLVSMYSVYSW